MRKDELTQVAKDPDACRAHALFQLEQVCWHLKRLADAVEVVAKRSGGAPPKPSAGPWR